MKARRKDRRIFQKTARNTRLINISRKPSRGGTCL